ncbi:STAS domain-containing protein [Mycobacterium talmoniae]|uniref:Anti-anti-sigma factor n=1 Tax=Mycobacterium talmoniae TaxID=1858794 RepID=A0A1S1NS87_9MYCO|nr:STAS domain-containing protein [Mycobacterium talmoniae]OHV06658.1 anti-anti-sigma factor [Mycobacterium talmoniae]
MTSMNANTARRFAYRYGNPVFECDGAEMRAQCRQLATVVTVSGDIHPANLDRVTQYATRFVLPEKPFVLDLSNVRALPAQAISLLRAVDEACHVIGVDWCLVAGQPVDEVLRTHGEQDTYAVTDTVPEALNYFLDGILARRRLLPLLHKTA